MWGDNPKSQVSKASQLQASGYIFKEKAPKKIQMHITLSTRTQATIDNN